MIWGKETSTWDTTRDLWAEDAGTWKTCYRAWVKDGTAWKLVHGPTPRIDGRVLLMHFDGTEGSTTFTDSGYLNIPFFSYGAYVDTATKKFGTGSINFSGMTGIVNYPLSYGSHLWLEGDFTVDFWSTQDVVGGFNIFMASTASDYTKLLFYLAPEGFMGCFNDWVYGDQPANTLAFPWSAGVYPWNASGQWNHVAIVRKDFVVTLYINGVSVGSQEYTYTIGNVNYDYIELGGYNGIHGAYGNMDELRILNGTAAWTADFTPPVAPYV